MSHLRNDDRNDLCGVSQDMSSKGVYIQPSGPSLPSSLRASSEHMHTGVCTGWELSLDDTLKTGNGPCLNELRGPLDFPHLAVNKPTQKAQSPRV